MTRDRMNGSMRLAAGGEIDRSRPLDFTFDGASYRGFAGDTLATWPGFDQGWPCFILNFKQNWASLVRLAKLEGVEILAVGHGEPITHDGTQRLRTLLQKSGHWPASASVETKDLGPELGLKTA